MIEFSKHALERLEIRKIELDEVVYILKSSKKVRRVGHKNIVRGNLRNGTVEVVYEKKGNNINIITVYWS